MLQRTQMLKRRGGILSANVAFHVRKIRYSFIMENSIIVFTRDRLFMLSCALDRLCFLLGKVCSQFSLRKDCLCLSNLHVQCIQVE